MKKTSKLSKIIDPDFWYPEPYIKNKFKYALNKFMYLLLLSFKGFAKDSCFLHVATLTYYSILSVVPIIAMGFAIAKGFGMEHYLYDIVTKPDLQNREIWVKVIDFAHTSLDRTKGSAIAAVGVSVLLYSILNMLQNVEYAFNTIWKQTTSRTILRKITDYISIVLLFPILLILSFSIAIYIQSVFTRVTDQSTMFKDISIVIIWLVKIIPFIIISIVFSFLYIVITNKNVRLKSAFYGGLFAGILFQLFQNFYIFYQLRLTSYNAVYGSFAALPFFFIWMYYSWTIILLGAEVAMHHETYSKSKNANHQIQYSNYQEKMLAIFIMHEILQNFKQHNNRPISADYISQQTQQPLQSITYLMDKLIDAGLINEIKTKDDTRQFQPAFSENYYSIFNIVNPLDHLKPQQVQVLDLFITHNKPEYINLKQQFDALITNMNKKNTSIV